jgi:hypothetical protein
MTCNTSSSIGFRLNVHDAQSLASRIFLLASPQRLRNSLLLTLTSSLCEELLVVLLGLGG